MSETSEEHEQESAGLPDPDEVSDQEKEELEQDRQQRLDPDSRPDSAEVDNTDRTFDPETGLFTDNPDHSEADPVYSAEDEA